MKITPTQDVSNQDVMNAACANFGMFGITHNLVFKLSNPLDKPSVRMKDTKPQMSKYFSRNQTDASALKELTQGWIMV